jgi:hypothetical protein
MLEIVSVILIILIACSFFRHRINTLRQIQFNEMEIAFHKMEIFVLSKNLQSRKNVFKYMLPFKLIVQNKGFADIQVLLGLSMLQDERTLLQGKQQYEKMLESIPEELKRLGNQFDKHLNESVNLSKYRAEFLFYFAPQIIKAAAFVLVHRSVSKWNGFWRNLNFVQKYENVVISNGYNNFSAC